MMLPHLLALSLAIAPNLVSAALFPENTLVKMIDHKGFKNALKQNMTFGVAFVAPWCGHCQKMAPEYSKAALGLYPLVPLYAVDCDAAKNKRLCADNGVKGFPTIKLFPRGKDLPPRDFDEPNRSASAFYYWASRGIPNKIKKIVSVEDIPSTANSKENIDKPRALLMNKTNKKPLLWSVLANKYKDQIVFFTHRDRKGKDSVKMGFEAGEDGVPKVLIYPAGESKPVQYDGIMKFDSLSKFFDSVLDGTADLASLNAEAAAEEFVPDEKELEIERQQEAEMLKLAHGGFADMIDFEAAVRDGSAKNFHGANGYPGMMGGAPPVDQKYLHKHAGGSEGAADESSAQDQAPTSASGQSKKIKMPVTGEAGQIVLEVPTEAASATATATEEAKTPESESIDAESESIPVEDATSEPPVDSVLEGDSERIKDEL